MTRPMHGAWVVAAMFVATLGLAQAASPVAPASTPDFDAIPLQLGGLIGQAARPLDPDVAKALAADRYLHRFYRGRAGRPIEMDVAYYAQPRVGANMHSPLNCLPGTGWTMGEPRSAVVGAWQVRTVDVSRGSARFAMAYWFQGRARVESDEIAARLHLLGDALRRQPTDASLVRLILPASGSPEADHAALTAFAGVLIPAIAATY